MSYEARDAFAGLLTNVAETKAPGTALRVADNVVIRQPGAVEPRQGFEPFPTEFSLAFTDLTQAQAHGPDMLYETNGDWRAKAGAARKLVLWPFQSPSNVQKYRADSFSIALARGNMYMPHLRGVAVAPDAATTRWRNAGLAQNFSQGSFSDYNVLVDTDPRGLPPMSQWAYRMVAKRTDANGLVIRSAPTGAEIAVNTHATFHHAVSYSFQMWTPAGWDSYADEVEIYRTRAFPITVSVDDEMALVATLKVLSTGGPSGLTPTLDDVPDEDRGAALYTNPSREGFEGKNDPPPACAVIEPYRGHMFFGDCAGPQRFIVSHQMKDCTGLGDGVGWRDVTGTVTTGSPTITLVSSMVGLQVGMVRVTQGAINQGYILSYVGNTITMSQNQTAPVGVATPITFVDAIQVDGDWIQLTTNSGSGYEQINQTEFENALHSRSIGKFSGTRLTPALSGYAHTHLIEHTIRNDGAFPLRATHGNEMSPPLPLAGIDPAQLSSSDVYPNMLMWSKQEEPEHVPPTNYVLIAEKTKRILALVHTRDSLFIFKEDGVWRLSGYGGQWSIDPFDMTCFCLLPSSVRRLNNRIFLLSNQGVVAVSEDGVEPVSFSIADQTRKLIDDVRANFDADGYYHLSGIGGVAATVDDRNSEYILLLGTVPLELNGAQALVYNELSRAWTTFSFTATGTNGFAPQALALSPDNTPLILHNGGVKTSSYETEAVLGQTTRRMYDGNPIALSTVSVTDNGGTATLALAAPVSIVAGRDVLADDTGANFYIESVGSTTSFTVRVPDGQALPQGNGSVCRAFLCTVQPHGFLGSPQVGKFWCALELGFSRLLGPVLLQSEFSSAQPLAVESAQSVEQDFELFRVAGMAAHHLGTLALLPSISVEHARAWLLRTRIMWLAARGVVSLELVQLEARLVSPKRPQQSSSGVP